MKTKFEIQYDQNNILSADVEKIVKDDIKVNGIKINSLESLEIYYQPVNRSAYYVAKTKDQKTIISDEIKITK